MCYAYTPVLKPTGGLLWLPKNELFRLEAEGKIGRRADGFYYAKDFIPVYMRRDKELEVAVMRWDLVPRHFLQKENPALADMLKQKNSRAKGSKGFSAYNARVESIASLFSFRDPWREGLRMATPVAAFRERPNMEGAPKEFQGGRQFNIHLPEDHYLAGIWDTWRNQAGERLDSCTVITTDSAGNDKLRGIWHERCPVILTGNQLEEWLDPKTTPERAMQMCLVFPAEKMDVEEVPKEPKEADPGKKKNGPDGEPLLLDL